MSASAAAAAADAAAAATADRQAAYLRAFADRLRTHGYYGWWIGWRTLRIIALRAAEKKDGTPGLRTRAEFDALLAPHVAAMRASVIRAYWQAVAGPEICRAAEESGAAREFARSLDVIGMERLVANGRNGVDVRWLRSREEERVAC